MSSRETIERHAAATANKLAKEYPAALNNLRGLLREMAEADSAVIAYNSANPTLEPIAQVEARVRTTSATKDRVISEKRVCAWQTVDGGILDEKYAKTVRLVVPPEFPVERQEGNGRSAWIDRDGRRVASPWQERHFAGEIVLRHRGPMIDISNIGDDLLGRITDGWHPTPASLFKSGYAPLDGYVRPVRAIRREVERADRQDAPAPLANTIVLPALKASDKGWDGGSLDRYGYNPATVLERLDDKPVAANTRVVIEYAIENATKAVAA